MFKQKLLGIKLDFKLRLIDTTQIFARQHYENVIRFPKKDLARAYINILTYKNHF